VHTANDMLAPFIQNLPEYGFVMQNFWNDSNQKVVKASYKYFSKGALP
jgi:hypothetical protein